MKGTYKMTFYNQLFYYKLIPKYTHHPTNKKPHECGASWLMDSGK